MKILILVCGIAALLLSPLPALASVIDPAPGLSLQGSGSEAERAYRQGLAALAGDRLDEARGAFERALQADPQHAAALLGLAELAFRNRQLADAGLLIERALAAEPDNPHVLASHGRSLASGGRYLEAEQALVRAVASDPALVRAQMDLADLRATVLGKPQEAVAIYREVTTRQPDHAGAWYALGVALGRLGDAGAADALAEAARLEPDNPLSPVAMARLQAAGGDLAAALASVEHALTLKPGMLDALELEADLLMARGDIDAAIASYEALTTAVPTHAQAQLKRGMALQQAGRIDDASDAYLAAVAAEPRLSAAYNNLAWMAAERGQPLDEAKIWAERAVELAPAVPAFLDTLGWVHRARGELEQAEAALRRATALPGADTDVFAHLATVLEERGAREEALSTWRRVLELTPDHAQASEAIRRLGGG